MGKSVTLLEIVGREDMAGEEIEVTPEIMIRGGTGTDMIGIKYKKKDGDRVGSGVAR